MVLLQVANRRNDKFWVASINKANLPFVSKGLVAGDVDVAMLLVAAAVDALPIGHAACRMQRTLLRIHAGQQKHTCRFAWLACRRWG